MMIAIVEFDVRPEDRCAALAQLIEGAPEVRLDEAVPMAEVARAVAMSPRSLARHFSSESGMSWSAALLSLRMTRAIELLSEGNATLTEVSLAVGYSSPSAFNAAFHRLTGNTPGKYLGRIRRSSA